jgi:hypothetical protein
MSKKSTTTHTPNPVDFIRTRARSLAMHDCFINQNWKDTGLADIVVTRRQPDGNFTSGTFQVDIFCLGVKQTVYHFNKNEQDYKEMLAPMLSADAMVKVDYGLAHNIIYAANEFAGTYGFIPADSFTRITQYLLEPDTDDIQLIDIECGFGGKPYYIQGIHDDKAMVSHIIRQLDRTIGKGNYNFKLKQDYSDGNIDLDTDGEDFDYDGLSDGLSFEQAVQVFSKFENKMDKLEEGQARMFTDAVEVLFDNIIDDDLYQKYYDQFYDDLDIKIETESMPPEMFGKPYPTLEVVEQLKLKLEDIYALPKGENRLFIEKLTELTLEFSDIPYLPFLELYMDEDRDSGRYKQKLRLYEQRYRGYPLITITSLILRCKANPETAAGMELIPLRDFFPDRKSLSMTEIQQYLVYAMLLIVEGPDCSRLAAFHDAVADISLPDNMIATIDPIFLTAKINRIYARLT